MTKYFQVSEAAREVGCTPETIKRYEEQGIVAFQRILGQRAVTSADIETIRAHRAANPRSLRRRPLQPAAREPEAVAG